MDRKVQIPRRKSKKPNLLKARVNWRGKRWTTRKNFRKMQEGEIYLSKRSFLRKNINQWMTPMHPLMITKPRYLRISMNSK